MTAEELANAIPDSSVTKTVITNLESGRKRDLTATELFQIASALRMSPLHLVVSDEDAFAPVPITGLAEPYASMCVAEYLVAVDDGGIRTDLSRLGRVKQLFRYLRGLEETIYRHETIENFVANLGAEMDDPDAHYRLSNGLWTVWIRSGQLTDEAWAERIRHMASARDSLTRHLDRVSSGLIGDVPWLRARVARALETAARYINETEDGAAADPAE